MLFKSGMMTYEFLTFTYLGINFGLIYDLYRTIANPFENAEARTKKILMFAPSLFIIL